MDSRTTVQELREMVGDFVAARRWEQYHGPKNLASSIAIETAELMEHFQWLSIAESQEYLKDPNRRADVADEVADILIYLLSFANVTGIDLSEAVRNKVARNESRYPVGGTGVSDSDG